MDLRRRIVMDDVTFSAAILAERRSMPKPVAGTSDARLREVAMEFEAVYLAEVLAGMGVGREPETFGGGFGAEAFRSFLNEAYAERFVRRGGTGIADMVYRQLRGAIEP
jgi:Rod binding domain-containing protein